MPPVSEAQRRAMYAAAAGKSTLGIPQSVGKEFTRKDPGGKLPKRRLERSGNTDQQIAQQMARGAETSKRKAETTRIPGMRALHNFNRAGYDKGLQAYNKRMRASLEEPEVGPPSPLWGAVTRMKARHRSRSIPPASTLAPLARRRASPS
jgi:hypothetical protein